MISLHHYNHLANQKLLSPLCKWEHQRFRDVKSCAHCIQGRSGIPTQGPRFLSPFCVLHPMQPDSLWRTCLLGFLLWNGGCFFPITISCRQRENGSTIDNHKAEGWEERNCLAWFFTAGGQCGKSEGKDPHLRIEGCGFHLLPDLLSWLLVGCISYTYHI